ncbi:uncharacterized protein LOC144828300 [Lissotriton helveticus]
MSGGTEPDLEKGPPPHPRDPGPAGEKPQCPGGGFMPPGSSANLETGLNLCKDPSLTYPDSGYSDEGSSSSTHSLPDSEGQDRSGPRPGAVDGADSGGQTGDHGALLAQGDRRGSVGLHQDTERGGEDAESGGEMLLGRKSPSSREALKEGSGTEGQSLVRRRGPEGSTQTPPGEEESRKVQRRPSGVTLSSGKLLVLLCAVCALSLLLVLTICALTGSFSTQDIPVPAHLEPCPMNWLHSRNKCYYFSTMYKEEGDWDESQRFCSSHNGTLALFDNEDQLNFLMDISSGHHMWVGLQKRQNGIHWANGTACSSSLCSITDFGECAFIAVRALYMSSCGLPRPYICSKEPYV